MEDPEVRRSTSTCRADPALPQRGSVLAAPERQGSLTADSARSRRAERRHGRRGRSSRAPPPGSSGRDRTTAAHWPRLSVTPATSRSSRSPSPRRPSRREVLCASPRAVHGANSRVGRSATGDRFPARASRVERASSFPTCRSKRCATRLRSRAATCRRTARAASPGDRPRRREATRRTTSGAPPRTPAQMRGRRTRPELRPRCRRRASPEGSDRGRSRSLSICAETRTPSRARSRTPQSRKARARRARLAARSLSPARGPTSCRGGRCGVGLGALHADRDPACEPLQPLETRAARGRRRCDSRRHRRRRRGTPPRRDRAA